MKNEIIGTISNIIRKEWNWVDRVFVFSWWVMLVLVVVGADSLSWAQFVSALGLVIAFTALRILVSTFTFEEVR